MSKFRRSLCELAVDNYQEWLVILFALYVSSIDGSSIQPLYLRRELPCEIKDSFTRVRTNLCTEKNLRVSTLHGTGGTGRIFERLSVQVWDLKKAGQLFDLRGSNFVRTRLNIRTVQLFAEIARLRPGI